MPFTFDDPYKKHRYKWYSSLVGYEMRIEKKQADHRKQFPDLQISTFRFNDQSLDSKGVLEIIDHDYFGKLYFDDSAIELENHIRLLIKDFGATHCVFFLSLLRLNAKNETGAKGFIAWRDLAFRLPPMYITTTLSLDQLLPKVLWKLFAIIDECRNKLYFYQVAEQKFSDLEKLRLKFRSK